MSEKLSNLLKRGLNHIWKCGCEYFKRDHMNGYFGKMI